MPIFEHIVTSPLVCLDINHFVHVARPRTHLMRTHRVNIGGRQRVQFAIENGILVLQTAIFFRCAGYGNKELSLAYGSLDSQIKKRAICTSPIPPCP